MKFGKMSLTIALLAVACLPAAAHAQQFQIPFSFLAAGRAFPAGQYQIEHMENTTWRIDNGHASVMVLTDSVESPDRTHPFSLIFAHAGGTYTLHQIWPSDHYGRQIVQLHSRKTLIAVKDTTYVEVRAE